MASRFVHVGDTVLCRSSIIAMRVDRRSAFHVEAMILGNPGGKTWVHLTTCDNIQNARMIIEKAIGELIIQETK